jgi:hypothetical protein
MAIRDLTPDEWAKTVRSAGAGYASCTPAPDYSRIVASPTGHMMDAPSCCPDNPAEARFCRHCGKPRDAFTEVRTIRGDDTDIPEVGSPYPTDPVYSLTHRDVKRVDGLYRMTLTYHRGPPLGMTVTQANGRTLTTTGPVTETWETADTYAPSLLYRWRWAVVAFLVALFTAIAATRF